MFPPDADVSPYNPITTQSAADAKGPPRIIKHGNTRLPEQEDKPDRSVSAPPSPTRSRIDAAIAGTPCKTLNTAHVRESLLTTIHVYRPPEVTDKRRTLPGPFGAIADALGAWASGGEAAHDVGNAQRDSPCSIAVRRSSRHPYSCDSVPDSRAEFS